MFDSPNNIGACAMYYMTGFGCVIIWVTISLIIMVVDIHQDICGMHHNENLNLYPVWVILPSSSNMCISYLNSNVGPNNKRISFYPLLIMSASL